MLRDEVNPGFFEDSGLTQAEAAAALDKLLEKIETRLAAEMEKSLRFAGQKDAKTAAVTPAASAAGTRVGTAVAATGS